MENKKRPQLNLTQLLVDHDVPFEEGNSGWIRMPCPFCYKGDNVFGLGFNHGAWTCFKCGKLRTWETIAGLLDISISDARDVCTKYEGSAKAPTSSLNALRGKVRGVSAVKLPYGTAKMGLAHRDYLSKRGFNPSQLEVEWGLLGTGPLGEFKHRIIIPVIDGDGTTVCYQGRDITGKSKMKYKSCHNEDAVVPLKNSLYGLDKCQGKNWIVITEGPTKVWRLGPGATCTFGVVVTDNQLRILKQVKHRTIIFDHDEAGMRGADDLAARLSVFGGETDVLWLYGVTDVANISDEDAKLLMTRCGKK